MQISTQELNLQVHIWWPCFKSGLAVCMCDAEDVFEWLRIWHSTILLKFRSSVPLKKVGKLGNLSLNVRRESSWFWVADRLVLLETGLTVFEDIDSDKQSVATSRQGFIRILAFCYRFYLITFHCLMSSSHCQGVVHSCLYCWTLSMKI